MFGSTGSEYFRIDFSILMVIRIEHLKGFARHFCYLKPLIRMPFDIFFLGKIRNNQNRQKRINVNNIWLVKIGSSRFIYNNQFILIPLIRSFS